VASGIGDDVSAMAAHRRRTTTSRRRLRHVGGWPRPLYGVKAVAVGCGDTPHLALSSWLIIIDSIHPMYSGMTAYGDGDVGVGTDT